MHYLGTIVKSLLFFNCPGVVAAKTPEKSGPFVNLSAALAVNSLDLVTFPFSTLPPVNRGPDIRFAVVGTKSYFAKRGLPQTPQDLIDTIASTCACRPMAALMRGSSIRTGRELKVRVDGQLVFNGIFQVLDAAVAGLGLAFVPEVIAEPYLAKGRLKRVLKEWCPPWSGYHLYYPSCRHSSPAFALLVDALRYKR
jgi:DNA-binding transcriptional LysR family regulator